MFNRKPVPDPRFHFSRSKKKFPVAQVEEVASYLASESSVQAARMFELEQSGVDPALIRAALDRLRLQERRGASKNEKK